jgi:phospholipid transport system substrate-binding protein
MRTHQRSALSSLVIALWLGLATPALAGPPTDALRKHVDQGVKVLGDPALKNQAEARRAQLRRIAEEIFDFPDTARRALGPHWSARSPQQQQEFVRLFSELLERSYFSKIDNYQGERVNYTGETIKGDEAVVKTSIALRSGADVPVEYRMHLANGRWLVYDVVVEGVSLVSNYRTQFNKIVQTESYDALVQRLRAKDASEPAASAPSSRSPRDRDR